MVKFAYVECGLSIDEFYGLSFYEWGLEVQRARKRWKERNTEWEENAFLMRELMALTANINRNSKRRALPYEGRDFIPLSFDKPREEEMRMTPEEVEAKFKNVKFIKEKEVV